jgi:biopolymer transport protein ExbD
MASLFHRSRQRRAERAPLTAAGNLNLVPLIDVLTSIVFFSLLTYTGAAMAMLTSYDLLLPPTVVTADEARNSADQPKATLLLAVKLLDGNLRVEHSEEGGFRKDIRGMTTASMDTLEAVMRGIRRKYPQNADVLVVPSDEVDYDTVVKVLERLRMAQYTGISLGARARGQVTQASAR